MPRPWPSGGGNRRERRELGRVVHDRGLGGPLHFRHGGCLSEVCEQRDEKGLYARARRGEIKNFTGIDDSYERPSNPELIVDTTQLTVEQAGMRVLQLLRRRIKGAGSRSATFDHS